MKRMLLTKTAVFFELQLAGCAAFVLRCCIVAAFAVIAGQYNNIAH